MSKYMSHIFPENLIKEFLSKKAKCVLITITSSNINDVTREILNSFIQKFHNHKKAQNAYKRTKIKNTPMLICVLCFFPSVFISFSAFCTFCAFRAFSERKTKQKV